MNLMKAHCKYGFFPQVFKIEKPEGTKCRCWFTLGHAFGGVKDCVNCMQKQEIIMQVHPNNDNGTR
jgi:hypothetical protein